MALLDDWTERTYAWMAFVLGSGLSILHAVDVITAKTGTGHWWYELAGLSIPLAVAGIGAWRLITTRKRNTPE
jgi:hypothetical protein